MSENTTQVCTRCHVEKELSEFHRRRNRHQTICKECRNAEIREYCLLRSRNLLVRRKPSPIVHSNFPKLELRITELESKLRSLAASFANDKLDADDVYSEMILAILTKSKPSESDSYILQRADFTAQAYLAKQLTYSHYVGNLDVDEDALTAGGFKVVNTRSVEDTLIQYEEFRNFEKVIKSLPIENQKIIAMLSIGMNSKQIAKKLSVAKNTMEERIQSIRMQLTVSLNLNTKSLSELTA